MTFDGNQIEIDVYLFKKCCTSKQNITTNTGSDSFTPTQSQVIADQRR